MIEKVISWLTGAPVEQIGDYFKEKQRLKHELKLEKLRGKQAIARAKAEAEAAKIQQTANWELASIQNSGFKDEWVLGLISYPLVACFIPLLQDGVLQGFKVLGQTPIWYVGIVVTIFLAVYGIRWKHASDIKLPESK